MKFLTALSLSLLLLSCSKDFKEVKSLDLLSYEKNEKVQLKKDCASCHTKEVSQWKESDHFHSMNMATEQFVQASFNGETYKRGEKLFKFYKKDKKYIIKINSDEYAVQYTFGREPLQQYIIQSKSGKNQVVPVAWDINKKLWFDIYKDANEMPVQSLKWDKHINNWNNRCANCHSSGLVKNYDFKENDYKTKFESVNISCFSCHGNTNGHILWANGEMKSKTKGFERSQTGGYPTVINPMKKKTHSVAGRLANSRADSKCFACHSLREDLTFNNESNEDFFNQYSMRIVNQQQYFIDGQAKEEVFVLGSFTQSKMFHNGVTCLNCHDPHNGKLKHDGNKTCLQCHSPTYEKIDHTKHTKQISCASCHMPSKKFMGIDSRRDHSFVIPRPDYSQKYGTPNSCTSCHQDKSKHTLSQQFKKMYSPLKTRDHLLEIVGDMKLGNFKNKDKLVEFILNKKNPEMKRAYAISYIRNFPSLKLDFFEEIFKDDSLLLKKATLELLQSYPNIDKLKHLLIEQAKTKTLMISYSAIYALALHSHDIRSDKELSSLLDSLIKNLIAHSDTPSNILKLAALSTRGYFSTSREELLTRTISNYPDFVPAYINLADSYRDLGQNESNLMVLEQALKINPKFGATLAAIGLYYIRVRNYPKAIKYLKMSHLSERENAYYAYIYGVTLNSVYGFEKAIKFVEDNLKHYRDSFIFNQLAFSLSVERQDEERTKKYIKVINKFRN